MVEILKSLLKPFTFFPWLFTISTKSSGRTLFLLLFLILIICLIIFFLQKSYLPSNVCIFDSQTFNKIENPNLKPISSSQDISQLVYDPKNQIQSKIIKNLYYSTITNPITGKLDFNPMHQNFSLYQNCPNGDCSKNMDNLMSGKLTILFSHLLTNNVILLYPSALA
jgi:hypothetical protein